MANRPTQQKLALLSCMSYFYIIESKLKMVPGHWQTHTETVDDMQFLRYDSWYSTQQTLDVCWLAAQCASTASYTP